MSGTHTCLTPARVRLRLPSRRAVRARGGSQIQPGEASDRPLRESGERHRSKWSDEVFGYTVGDPACRPAPGTAATRAGAMPRSIVVDPAFTWGDDRPPDTPWNRTVIYECHVKGMTMRHPGVPENSWHISRAVL